MCFALLNHFRIFFTLLLFAQTDEILEIQVRPGWKKGTKITFPEKGDERPGIIPADIVFVLDERPHSRCLAAAIDFMTLRPRLEE